MNKQQFIQFIQSPEKLNSEAVGQLNSLIHDFPYFQTAHLLYLKSLHNQSSIHYNSQLKIAAAYVTDRKVLYNLITDKSAIATKTENTLSKQNENALSEQAENVSKETIELPLQEEMQQEEFTLEDVKTLEQENTTEEIISDKDTNTQIEEKLNAQILAEIINTSAIYEILQTETTSEADDKPKITETPTLPSLNTSEQHSFSDWLKQTKSSSGYQTSIEISKQNALVDSFITTEPKLISKKTAFYSPVDMARKSVIEDISIITETLAKVYMQQGNLITAKKAYENLSLKFPEKSVYFAAQIKIINKQLNSKK